MVRVHELSGVHGLTFFEIPLINESLVCLSEFSSSITTLCFCNHFMNIRSQLPKLNEVDLYYLLQQCNNLLNHDSQVGMGVTCKGFSCRHPCVVLLERLIIELSLTLKVRCFVFTASTKKGNLQKRGLQQTR